MMEHICYKSDQICVDNDETMKESEDICPICLEAFDESSTIVFPQCCDKHFYHSHCMNRLILQTNSVKCPLDRKPFSSYKYYNSVGDNEIITTQVFWYKTNQHQIMLFSHFFRNQYIGTNLHSVELKPSNFVTVNIFITGIPYQSFQVNLQDELENSTFPNQSDKWNLNLQQDYHRQIVESSVKLIPSSSTRHLMISLYTGQYDGLIDDLMAELDF